MTTIFMSHGLWKLVEKWITFPNDLKKKKKVDKVEAVDDDDDQTAAMFMKAAKALRIIQNAVSSNRQRKFISKGLGSVV